MSLPADLSTTHCRNCGVELAGKFCHACGQKKLAPSERTFRYFVIQFLGSAFFLENNFLKNVWFTIARPGLQAIDFIEGRQKRWMPPFSLFLLINLFYFWYTPLSDMNLTLHEQVDQFQHSFLARPMLTDRLEKRQVSFAEYEKEYNAKSSGYSNSLIILHVPLFALMLMVLYKRAGYYFADHFIVCLYFLAFLLLMALGVVALVELLSWLFPSASSTLSGIFSWLLTVCTLTYTFIYLRNIFQQRWYVTAIKTVVFLFCFFAVHMIYRTILFLIIFWAT